MMKCRMKRIIAIGLCIVILAGLLCGCGEKGKVEKLIKNYERACHSGELDSILDCYDPNIVNPLRSVTKLIGIGTDKLLNLITPLLGTELSGVDLPDVSSVLDVLKTLKLKPVSYEFNGDKTKCSVKAECSVEILGSVQTITSVFNCVLRDGKWYVTV